MFFRKCWGFLALLLGWVFKYETPKIVTIKSVKVGLAYRFLQLSIVAYIVGYVILYCKGYQDIDTGLSTVLIKTKGLFTELTDNDDQNRNDIWDSADFTVPPVAKETVFVTTNVIITAKQRQTACVEDNAITKHDSVEHLNCNSDKINLDGHGVATGRKLHDSCEILGWCPIENDTFKREQPMLTGIEDATIMFKNYVDFTKFKVKRSNINLIKNVAYGKSCLYKPVTDEFCPILKVGDIIKFAGGNRTKLALEGGLITVVITWNCNFDYNTSHCKPAVKFSSQTKDERFSAGYNFRYARYYRLNGTLHRDLIKAFGLLIVFYVEAKAAKFNIIQLGFNVGAGLALLSFASVFMDIILLYCVTNRKYYHQQKIVTVTAKEIKLTRSQSTIKRQRPDHIQLYQSTGNRWKSLKESVLHADNYHL